MKRDIKALFLALLVVGCAQDLDLVSGKYLCGADSSCPAGFFCSDGLCVSEPGQSDTSGDVAGLDGLASDVPVASAVGLAFDGSGFTPHDGQTLYVAVVDAATRETVATESVLVQEGAFSFRWPALLEIAGTYHINYFVDVNGNGLCDVPPDDHVWVHSIDGVDGAVTVELAHTFDFDGSGCTPFPTPEKRTFDLMVTGTQYHPHEDQNVYVAVVERDSSKVVATEVFKVVAGSFGFSWQKLLVEGQSYVLDLYADVNGDAVCEDPPTDHAWRYDIPEVSGKVDLQLQHSFDFNAEACSSF